MFTEGIFPIGDGLLDIDEKRLQGLLVQDDINEIYEVEQTPFARGKFAAVRRAIHKNSGVHFAAKFLKRRRRAQSSDKEIKHEIAVLMLCEGEENIVKLNAVHESRSDTALLLELATGGELQTFLDNEDCLSEAHARICMREVLKALQFLHKRSIAHLDLKPQNILLTGERIEDGLKLCDFGISRVVAEGTNVREIAGTPDYVAPEVLQYEPLSLLTDIWSVGVLAYVLLSGFSPFGGETKQETFLNISQCALTFPEKLFGGISAAAIDFIRQTLRIKPSERMTAAGCLEHFWLKDECSIERQLFNGIANKQANVNVDDLDVDEEDAEVEEPEESEAEVQDISIDEEDNEENVESTVEEETINGIHEQAQERVCDDQLADDGIVIDDNNQARNGCKMDSSDTEIEYFTTNTSTSTQQLCNGKCTMNTTTIASTALVTAKPSAGKCTKVPAGPRPAIPAKPITTTTAILTLPPANRATTIPLYHVQQQYANRQQHTHHQQQQPYITARRQSSESNKENTYLATKQISHTTTTLIKKPIMAIAQTQAAAVASSTTTTTTSATSTATIIIGTPPTDSAMNGHAEDDERANIITTIALPNCGGAERNKQQQQQQQQHNNQHCLFPDAPTTPKVIRKAPTTDTSPTSVKALVKKFQLETGKQMCEKHLKETQLHQHQQPELHNETVCNGQPATRRASTHNVNGTIANGKHTPASEQQCKAMPNTATTKQTKYISSNGKDATNSAGAVRTTRRASEPITGVHKKSTTIVALAPRHSVAATTATANYKSTCVFGIGCNGRSNSVTTTIAPNECRHSSGSANTNNTNNNNNTNTAKHNLRTTSPTANGTGTASTTTSTAAAALLLSSHQHLQQHHHQLQPHHAHHLNHHHHHHHVAKTATNNLSMDQGIIC